MKDFKGFDNWIEIFEGGKQIDSNGVEHDGDALIDKAVQSFTPGYHEPPLVVGHPTDNSPAFGWVEGLRKVVKKRVNILMAKFKQVVPEFEDLAKKGLYKKRSASFYPDGRLRHVGFLGAAPPAVKGLADLRFQDADDAISFDFYDPGLGSVARILRNLRDWMIEKEGKETADSIIPDWDVDYIREQADKSETETGIDSGFKEKEGDNMTFKDFMEAFKFWKEVEKDPALEFPGSVPAAQAGSPKSFTEVDLEAARTEAASEERTKVAAEFAEKEGKALEDARKKDLSGWVDQKVKEGKILPSWADSGLVGFMQGLDAGTEIEFAEGADKKTPLKFFQELPEGLEKSPIFKEIATKEKAGDSGDFAEAKEDEALGDSIAAKVNPVESN